MSRTRLEHNRSRKEIEDEFDIESYQATGPGMNFVSMPYEDTVIELLLDIRELLEKER